MSLFYCIIFPVGKYYSLSNKLFMEKQKFNVFNYQRVIQIHLCIIYFSSGVSKFLDYNWWNGNSMWKSVASIYNNYSQIPTVILTITGIGVILLETLYPFLVVSRRSRLITISLCILMHISIGVMLKLYSFAAIMIV